MNQTITLYNKSHSRAVVIHNQDNKSVWANLFVNARDGIQDATITLTRWEGKTVKGAEKWAKGILSK